MPWSIRNFLATHNLLAVSANLRETAMNTEQALDTVFLADASTVLNCQVLKFPNRDELTGKEEPDRVHDLGGKVAGVFSFSRAQPQHLAFLLAYGLGEAASSAVGAEGYRHTITPRSGEVDECRSNPSFTAAMRFGRQVLTRRYASCFIDQVRLELARDGWAKASGSVLGSGKVEDNSRMEEVSAAWNAESLTLAANGVEGGTAAERLSNVQAIKALNPATQAWEDVHYLAVSGETPAAIAITPPGMTGDLTVYRVYYLPVENGWTAFPDRVEEPPLKVSQVEVFVGGRWDGAQYLGGHRLAAQVRRLTWTLRNNLEIETVPGAGGNYANRAFRAGRDQKLEVNRDFRDFLMAQHLKDNDYLAFYLKAVGPEFEPGRHYQMELIFPRVAVVAAPVKPAQRRLAEDVELAVLEDDQFGSVVAYVQNKVSSYAG
jgi:hypothetical protein